MPGPVVDPALLSQLCHDGINPGETGPTLSPLGQRLWVLVPRDLETDKTSVCCETSLLFHSSGARSPASSMFGPTWTQMGFPSMRSKLGLLVAAV